MEHRITLGDSNTRFFFRSVQVRRVRNTITFLNETNVDAIEEVDQIRATYKELYAPSEIPQLDFYVFDDIDPSYILDEDIGAWWTAGFVIGFTY